MDIQKKSGLKFISNINFNFSDTKMYFLFCRLDQMFSDAFSRDHQLLRADPKHSLYLACALMVRGNVEISDVRRNIERYRNRIAINYDTLQIRLSVSV